MLYPLPSRYVPDPSKQAMDLSFKFPPTCTKSTRWTSLFRGDFPTFPARVKFGVEVFVETRYRTKNVPYRIYWNSGTRHVRFKHSRYNNLSFDLTHSDSIVFSCQLRSFCSPPKAKACFIMFLDISDGCSWRLMMVLQFPFSLGSIGFLSNLTKFWMKGISWGSLKFIAIHCHLYLSGVFCLTCMMTSDSARWCESLWISVVEICRNNVFIQTDGQNWGSLTSTWGKARNNWYRQLPG